MEEPGKVHVEKFGPVIDVNSSVRPHALCGCCRKICEESRFLEEMPLEARYEDVTEDFDHYKTGVELESSYLGGCHLCTLIWHSMVEREHDMLKSASHNPTDAPSKGLGITFRIEILGGDYYAPRYDIKLLFDGLPIGGRFAFSILPSSCKSLPFRISQKKPNN